MEGQHNNQKPNYQQNASESSVVNIYQNNNKENEVISLGDWILTIILTGIPIIGFICLFVWALSSSTPLSKKNWAKANLIIMIIVWVLAIISLIVFWGVIAAAMNLQSRY